MTDIEKGHIFNHRDGMSELRRFEMGKDAKPMTAEERAKALVRHFERGTLHEFDDLVKYTIKQIQQVCDEARAEAYTQGCADTIHNAPMYEEGFFECRGKTEALAEFHSGPSIQLVQKIHALKPDK